MKKFAMTLSLLSALIVMSAQAFAGTCSNTIKQSIEDQAKADFPGKQINVLMPEVDESGGAVDQYNIPVTDQSGHILTTYQILVNEVCMTISLNRI